MVKVNQDLKEKSERRKAPRIPLCLATAAGCDAWLSVCFTKDVGEAGIFLISQRIPRISMDFSIELQMPSRLGFLRQTAIVVRTQHDNPRGFALEWKNLTKENATILKVLRQRWESAFGPREENSESKMQS